MVLAVMWRVGGKLPSAVVVVLDEICSYDDGRYALGTLLVMSHV